MTDRTGLHRGWPKEVDAARPKPKRGLLARAGRLIGDVGLTIGMGKAFDASVGADRDAINRVMLFGEGDSRARDMERDR